MTVVLPRPAGLFRDARPRAREESHCERDPDVVDRSRGVRRRVIVFVVSVVALAGLVAALFGERGFFDVRRSRAELREMRSEVERQFEEVQALKEQVRNLREDPAALERIAREELGFGRKGEIQLLLPRGDEENE